MNSPPAAAFETRVEPLRPEIEGLYRALSKDARYGHYVRIPERICRCLDHFKIAFDRAAVTERLHSFYLFIGVADDALDADSLEAGIDILRRMQEPSPCFTEETHGSRVSLVTEALKRHIGPELHPLFLTKLEELYARVVAERSSKSVEAYAEERKAIGRLTAELSYMLVSPLLRGEQARLRSLLHRVGAVGCLIDSVIDLREDGRLGLLGFKPRLSDHLKLAARSLFEGTRILFEHPRLLVLFLESVGDDLLDRCYARKPQPASIHVNESTQSAYACEPAS